MSPTVAVVGATGNVGHSLVNDLLRRGVPVRAIARGRERLLALQDRGAEIRAGSADDPRFLAEAFRGAEALLAMLPPDPGHPEPRQRRRQVADAIAAGAQIARMRYVVTVSSIGADGEDAPGPLAGLWEMEQRFNRIPGLNLVHLRAGYFFQNLLAMIGVIRSAGVAGAGFDPELPLAMVDARDVGTAAAELLAAPTFAGLSVRELQGPRSYTFREAAGILGAAIGRPDLGYVQFPAHDVRQALLGAGFSPASADGLLAMIAGFNSGAVRSRQPRSPATTTPTTLEEFARDSFAPAFHR